ncbi:MAG TPA: VCBS repeat-containing protein [Polyangia bacterium]|nr:VCBS repeat-containing protein [Polyangia bacterium]
MSSKSRLFLMTSLLCCAAGVTSLHCGFSGGASGTGGTTGSGSGGNGAAGTTGSGGSGNPGSGGSGNPGSGGDPGTDASTTGSGGSGNPGTGGGAPGSGGTVAGGTFKNYEYTGMWPNAPIALATKPGKLTYTKIVIHNQFLAESCSIGDYNNDGMPDVSSGRIWYQGPDFKTKHAFRSGHGVLPSNGDPPEINTGVSDDWADFPYDMDGDGWTDIINVAQCDVNEVTDTANKVGTVQPHATAIWYRNPGSAAALAGDPMWVSHQMHTDVRLEHHGLVDMNGDGYPELLGACKNCNPATTKGYYQGDPKNPNNPWTFHSVTRAYTFPFGGTGWMHGLGAGDVNGDGKPDLLERGGVWFAQGDAKNPTWNQTMCTGANTPAGCGWVAEKSPLLPTGLYDGKPDADGNKGASHMFAVDMDKDGKVDIVAADWAHGIGLYWYKQGDNMKFTKYQFMGDSAADVAGDPAKWGAGFTEPHALQVVDMDGDGRPDVVTGKMRFAHPHTYGDPDSDSTPYIYVFKNVATMDSRTGAPITLQPIKVDGDPTKMPGTTDGGMGVGRQLAVGHANNDGIMDICVGTKVGLAVFLGQ